MISLRKAVLSKDPLAEFTWEGSSLTKSASWLVFAKTVAFIFSFLLPLVLVRQLSLSEFGVYRQVFLVVNTAVGVLPVGFAMSAYYFFPRERGRKEGVVLNIFLFYVLVASVLGFAIVLWPGLLAVIVNSPDMLQYESLIALVLLFWVSSSFFETIAIANGETGLAGAVVIITNLARTVLLLGAALFSGSVLALIYAALIQGFLQMAILMPYLASRFPGLWHPPNWRLLRAQLGYALPLGFAALLWSFQMDLHYYFVSNRFGPTAYAIYSIGCLQLPLWSVLLESVGLVMIPAVSYLQSKNNHRQIVTLTARMMRKLAALCFPIYFFLLVSGREFILVLFTERYLESWPIFAISLTLIPLSLISSAYDPVFRAYPEHLSYLMKTRVVLLVPLLAGLWYGTERFGLVGAIAVVVGLNLIERLVIAFKVGQILEVSWRDLVLFKDVAKLLFAAMAAALATGLARNFMQGTSPLGVLAFSGIVFGFVYLSWIFILGVLAREEREALHQAVVTFREYAGFRK